MDKGKETARLISLLRSAGLSVFPYKGLAFSLLFYGDIGMRESGDIDLIIKPEELPLVNDLLKEDGYLPEEEDFVRFLGWDKFTKTRRGYNLKKLDRTGLPVHLELHWRVTYNYFGVGKFNNAFSYETDELLTVYQQRLPLQNKFEQFKYLYVHHSMHDGHGYLKTALDIAMGLKKLNPTAEDYTQHPILRELTGTFSLAAAVEASNSLFGTDLALPAHRRQQKLAARLVETTLLEKSRQPGKMGSDFASYFRHHTGLIHKRAQFYPELSRKMQFYIQNLAHFFQPNVDDYRIFRPKSLWAYRLIWIIRPLRQLFTPTDPLHRKQRSEEKAQIDRIRNKTL